MRQYVIKQSGGKVPFALLCTVPTISSCRDNGAGVRAICTARALLDCDRKLTNCKTAAVCVPTACAKNKRPQRGGCTPYRRRCAGFRIPVVKVCIQADIVITPTEHPLL